MDLDERGCDSPETRRVDTAKRLVEYDIPAENSSNIYCSNRL